MRYLAIILLPVMLAGCISRPAPAPVSIPRTVIEPCPIVPPPVACPDMPALPSPAPIEAVEDAWVDAQAVHRICTEALEAWQESWSVCSKRKE